MIEEKPTYDLASDMVAAHVQPLWQGALSTSFATRDEDGRRLNLEDDHLSGKHLILIFLNETDEATNIEVLKSFSARRAEFDQHSTTVIAVGSDGDGQYHSRLKRASGFFWPITSDCSGGIFASYGLHKRYGEKVRLVLLTPFRQIRSWFDGVSNIDDKLEVMMSQIEPMESVDDQKWFPSHAPVLMIPNVLSRKECNQLIHSFETGGPFIVKRPPEGEMPGDYKMPIYEHNRQDRVDHMIKDKAMMEFLTERISTRINPMVKKAFAFDVTRREAIHIARYYGERGGNQMGHRDNTSPETAYRRFALSMNLNDNFEGGGVVFREYNQHPYRGVPGTALIFSSSLLHEVLETTKGTRYSLISHLFNDSTLSRR
jgi:peroxiredoxin/predicted 2-oxoglutarate/Fe(II)-dependent dioxygenase YbiX